MAEIKWILTCDMTDDIDCATMVNCGLCPTRCPNSHYEKEQPNTEVPDGE